jgi:hypothetical protein
MLIRVCNTRPIKPKLLSKIIMKWEGTDYSHSIAIFGDWVYESSSHGCAKLLLSDFLKENIIVTEDRREVSLERYAFLLNKAEQAITDDIPYGYLNLLGVAINDVTGWTWFADGAKSMICSEFIFWIFQDELGIPDEEIDLISPRDLFKKYFNMVYV